MCERGGTQAAPTHRLFPDSQDVPHVESVLADDVPEPYRQPLVLTHHMTVTVERFYGEPVDVKVLMGDG